MGPSTADCAYVELEKRGVALPVTLDLVANETALVVIDLQKGIVGMPTLPHPATRVVENAVRLAEKFRELSAFVVLVHVGPSPDFKDGLRPLADVQMPQSAPPAPGWDQIVPELGPKTTDHVVHKRQWGAFYGTDLDLQLRRRGVKTIVLCGIATHIGVESTARDAYERGYQQVFVDDAMSDMSEEAHFFTLKNVMARIGRVRSTEEVLAGLRGSL